MPDVQMSSVRDNDGQVSEVAAPSTLAIHFSLSWVFMWPRDCLEWEISQLKTPDRIWVLAAFHPVYLVSKKQCDIPGGGGMEQSQ